VRAAVTPQHAVSPPLEIAAPIAKPNATNQAPLLVAAIAMSGSRALPKLRQAGVTDGVCLD